MGENAMGSQKIKEFILDLYVYKFSLSWYTIHDLPHLV